MVKGNEKISKPRREKKSVALTECTVTTGHAYDEN